MAEYRDGTTRRRQVAEAALELLGVEGPDAVTMKRLAAAIGVVPSAVYRHFANKQAVLDAAFDLVVEAMSRLTDRATRGRGEASSRLKRLVVGHARLVARRPGVARLVFGSFAFAESVDRRGRVRDLLAGYRSVVTDLVRQGQTAGEFRTDLAAETAAVVVLGLVQPAVILRHLTDGAFDPVIHVRRAWPVFIDGMRR